jgi:hypothetical protein
MTNDRTKARGLVLHEIPEMARPVGLHGALRQTEVGGSACFALLVTMAIYSRS